MAEPACPGCSWSASGRSCCARTCGAGDTCTTTTITTITTIHDHGHSHAPPEQLSWRGIVAMGAAAGLIPCPSALVVLLGAIAQGQIALGMVMIVAFSLGLATTLTALGLTVVYAGRVLGRLNVPSRIVTALPAVSAVADRRRRLVLTVKRRAAAST